MIRLLLLFSFLPVFAFQTTEFKLSNEEFLKKLQSLPDAQLVDVRTQGEFRKNHLKGAMNLNVNGEEFQKQVNALDKTKPVLVYCWSGGRSSNAAEYMRQQGLTVYEMKDGMMRWIAENKPYEEGTAPAAGMSMEEYNGYLKSKKLVLVDFNATWCAPCRKMSPWLDELAKKYPNDLIVVKINTEENGTVVKTLNVAGVPYLMLYKNEKVIWTHSGLAEKSVMEAEIEKALK